MRRPRTAMLAFALLMLSATAASAGAGAQYKDPRGDYTRPPKYIVHPDIISLRVTNTASSAIRYQLRSAASGTRSRGRPPRYRPSPRSQYRYGLISASGCHAERARLGGLSSRDAEACVGGHFLGRGSGAGCMDPSQRQKCPPHPPFTVRLHRLTTAQADGGDPRPIPLLRVGVGKPERRPLPPG